MHGLFYTSPYERSYIGLQCLSIFYSLKTLQKWENKNNRRITCFFFFCFFVLFCFFHVPFYSISVISGHCEGDNERLWVMEPRFRLNRILHPAGYEPGPLA